MLTISVIKADTGGFVGHTAVRPDAVKKAEDILVSRQGGLLTDYRVAQVGDDIALIMTHNGPTASGTTWRAVLRSRPPER